LFTGHSKLGVIVCSQVTQDLELYLVHTSLKIWSYSLKDVLELLLSRHY